MPSFTPQEASYAVEVPYATETVVLDLRGRSRYLSAVTVDGTRYRGQAIQAQVDCAADE